MSAEVHPSDGGILELDRRDSAGDAHDDCVVGAHNGAHALFTRASQFHSILHEKKENKNLPELHSQCCQTVRCRALQGAKHCWSPVQTTSSVQLPLPKR